MEWVFETNQLNDTGHPGASYTTIPYPEYAPLGGIIVLVFPYAGVIGSNSDSRLVEVAEGLGIYYCICTEDTSDFAISGVSNSLHVGPGVIWSVYQEAGSDYPLKVGATAYWENASALSQTLSTWDDLDPAVTDGVIVAGYTHDAQFASDPSISGGFTMDVFNSFSSLASTSQGVASWTVPEEGGDSPSGPWSYTASVAGALNVALLRIDYDTGPPPSTVTVAPPLRIHPRSDGLGLSSARRVYPPSPSIQASNRQVGGYL